MGPALMLLIMSSLCIIGSFLAWRGFRNFVKANWHAKLSEVEGAGREDVKVIQHLIDIPNYKESLDTLREVSDNPVRICCT
jgi:hypothetical protein